MDITNSRFKMSAAIDKNTCEICFVSVWIIYVFDRRLYAFSRFTTGTRVDDTNKFLILRNYKTRFFKRFYGYRTPDDRADGEIGC
jgi:hypothetical protein